MENNTRTGNFLKLFETVTGGVEEMKKGVGRGDGVGVGSSTEEGIKLKDESGCRQDGSAGMGT